MNRSIASYCNVEASLRVMTRDKWQAEVSCLDIIVKGRFEKTTGKIKNSETQEEQFYNAIFYMPPIDDPLWTGEELDVKVFDKIQVPLDIVNYDANEYGIIKVEGLTTSDSREPAAQSKAFIKLYLE